MLPFALGTQPLGGTNRPLVEPDAPELPITLHIGGQDLTAYLQLPTLHGTEELNTRGTLDFTLIDNLQELNIQPGLRTRLTVRGSVVWNGLLDDIKEELIGDVAIFFHCGAVDLNSLFDRHFISALYPAGKTFRQIVIDIIDVQSGELGERLSDDGIRYTATSLPEGPELGRIKFNRITAAEAITKLCELVGYAWWTGHDSVFHAQDPATLRAPWPLDYAQTGLWRDARYFRDRDQYRNIQHLEAGKGTTPPVYLDGGAPNTAARTDHFLGDGKLQTFTLPLPAADKPRILISSSEVSPDDIAIKEQDEEALWFYQIADATITQHSDEAPVGDGVGIQVIYQAYYPIAQIVRDDDQINARAAVEETSGVYTALASDNQIDDEDLAVEYAEALLRRSGRLPQRITASTPLHGFFPGHLLPVRLPEHNIYADFLITSIRFGYRGRDFERPLAYTIDAAAGEYRGGWADFFRRAANAGRPFTIGDNEITHIVRHIRETLNISETLHILTGNHLDPWDADRYTRYIVGQSRIARTRSDGLVLGPRIGLPELIT